MTYLRPNGFATNALGWRDDIRAGKVIDPTGNGRQGVIDPEDIARVAAVALTQDGPAGKGYIPTGPQDMIAREQVQVLLPEPF